MKNKRPLEKCDRPRQVHQSFKSPPKPNTNESSLRCWRMAAFTCSSTDKVCTPSSHTTHRAAHGHSPTPVRPSPRADSGELQCQCFANVSQCAVAQMLVSARLRIVLDQPSPAAPEKLTSGVASRNSCSCVIVRSFVSSMLITIIAMIKPTAVQSQIRPFNVGQG